MNIPRSFLALGLVSVLCVTAGAAKKEHSSPLPERSATPTTAQQTVTGKESASPAIPATTTKTVEPNAEGGAQAELATPQRAGAAAYEIPWQTVNSGGGPMSSANYQVNASAGQSSIGYATSTNYQAGIGYWYGATATTGCSCPFQCDYDEDHFLTAVDLGSFIDVLFAGKPEEQDPDCPKTRGDFDCDGFPTALDLGNLIDHLFAGGPGPCDPCGP